MWVSVADNEGRTNNLRFALSIKISLKGVLKPSATCTSLASYITKQPQWGDGSSVCVCACVRLWCWWTWCTSLDWCGPPRQKFYLIISVNDWHTRSHTQTFFHKLQNALLTNTYALHIHHTIALAHKQRCLVNSGLNLTRCLGSRAGKQRAAEHDGALQS